MPNWHHIIAKENKNWISLAKCQKNTSPSSNSTSTIHLTTLGILFKRTLLKPNLKPEKTQTECTTWWKDTWLPSKPIANIFSFSKSVSSETTDAKSKMLPSMLDSPSVPLMIIRSKTLLAKPQKIVKKLKNLKDKTKRNDFILLWIFQSFEPYLHILQYLTQSHTINTQIYKLSVFDKMINLIFLPPLVKLSQILEDLYPRMESFQNISISLPREKITDHLFYSTSKNWPREQQTVGVNFTKDAFLK